MMASAVMFFAMVMLFMLVLAMLHRMGTDMNRLSVTATPKPSRARSGMNDRCIYAKG